MHKRTVGVNRQVKQLASYKNGKQYNVVRIRTRNDRPIWELFKEYINSLEAGEEFKRKDLMYAVYIDEAAKAMISRETTVDHYRLYASNVGFVDHVSRGKYKKMHDFPEEMTSSILKKFAYNDVQWKDWFIPKNQRLLSACDACKE